MKRYRGWLILGVFLVLCFGGWQLALRLTAEYPALGEPVAYPVNQLEGVSLSIQTASSPFQGYRIRYAIEAETQDLYEMTTGDLACLERLADGQWHRLESQRDQSFNSQTFGLGGEDAAAFQGEVVQKYDGYGTRLESGSYRLTVKLLDQQGNPHYLAAEFEAE